MTPNKDTLGGKSFRAEVVLGEGVGIVDIPNAGSTGTEEEVLLGRGLTELIFGTPNVEGGDSVEDVEEVEEEEEEEERVCGDPLALVVVGDL